VTLPLLVVDDEESILFPVREYFTARGYDVDCAQDVATAKDLMSRNRYAVVIADVRMGGGIDETQGLDLVLYLRERWPRVRAILITAYRSRAIEAEARSLGVGALLDKPVRLGALAEIVETLARQASGPSASPAS
jgi:two-component system, NtrC family, response regulator PilR